MKRLVVVVDDEPDLLAFVCEVLEGEGYEVGCLGHPMQTGQLARAADEPRLFLLDLMLPEIDGITLARRLRQEGFARTPMVAMSASATMLDAARGSGLFDAQLPKPFELDDLLACAHRYAG